MSNQIDFEEDDVLLHLMEHGQEKCIEKIQASSESCEFFRDGSTSNRANFCDAFKEDTTEDLILLWIQPSL